MDDIDKLIARENSNSVLSGLARQCPKCGIIAHYEVKGRKEVSIQCPECDYEFHVKKYRKGERPKRSDDDTSTGYKIKRSAVEL